MGIVCFNRRRFHGFTLSCISEKPKTLWWSILTIKKETPQLKKANYLQNFCKENNIPYEYFILNLPNQNFQDEARKARFKYLEETATKYKTNIILTAHHLNDLAETVLMKLSRGSNLFGYSGLQKVVHRGDYIYIKPLLHLKKIDLYQYAKNNQIQFLFF